jgi:hypothetical protein
VTSKNFYKDPDAVLEYVWDWTPWLTAESDTIASSTFTVGTGLTKNTDTHTATTATVWLAGGIAGTSVIVTNRIVTAGGRTDDRSATVIIRSA